jgi:predicted oxidoreductase (fatty acid repression mutant protein)
VKEEHDKLWEITKEVLKGIVPAENYPATEQRLNGFKAGYGTVGIFFSFLSLPVPQNQNQGQSQRWNGEC